VPSPAKLLREPLLWFFLLGGLLFLVHFALVSGRSAGRSIIVSAEVQERLGDQLAEQLGRAPTGQELQAVVAQHVDDEVLYREAVALGLDRSDHMVRRRLIQSMEFLLEGNPREPSDEQLQGWLESHRDDYQLPERWSIEQLFFDSQRRGDRLAEATSRALVQLQNGASSANLGDPFIRGRIFEEHSRQQLARIFGPQFVEALAALAPGKWQGPVRSSYGLHLVRIRDHSPARTATLDELRSRITNDWRNHNRVNARRRALDELRGRFQISLPDPREAADAQAQARGGSP